MKRVLVVACNELEKQAIEGTIAAAPDIDVEVRSTASVEEALAFLSSTRVDLMVADIPSFDKSSCCMIAAARRIDPSLPILITIIGRKKEVAAQAWRRGVQDYLLKPYRPTWLVSAVRTLLAEAARPPEQALEEGAGPEQYAAQIAEYAAGFEYKKCISTIREYLDLLYSRAHNGAKRRDGMLEFAEKLLGADDALGPEAQKEVREHLASFRRQLDRRTGKYEASVLFEKTIDRMFEIKEKEEGACRVADWQKMLGWVDRNVKRGITLDAAARHTNMSPNYFSKFFKKLTGENFVVYVTNQKIEHAKRMLSETDLPIRVIARELSYSEINYFCRVFKKHVGVTPTEFREASGKRPG